MQEKLRKKLLYLRERHGIVGLKGGTEVEDMSFDELLILKHISSSIVPMTVKIGGPEARNDMRFCLDNDIEVILAPMIESEYGLKNFVSTIKELAKDNIYKLYLAINLETITGYYNINQLIATSHFAYISQITIGRSDLAASMEYDIDHSEVYKVTKDIVKRAKKEKKITSIGGKIDPLSAISILNNTEVHKINTRHLSIELGKVKNLSLAVCEALSFEIELYKLLMEDKKANYEKKKSYEKRIAQTKLRIEKRNAAFCLL